MKHSCVLGFGMENIWKFGDNVGLSLQWQEQQLSNAICSTLILAVIVPDLTWPGTKLMFLINHLHIQPKDNEFSKCKSSKIIPYLVPICWIRQLLHTCFRAELSLHTPGSESTALCHGWQPEVETKKC